MIVPFPPEQSLAEFPEPGVVHRRTKLLPMEFWFSDCHRVNSTKIASPNCYLALRLMYLYQNVTVITETFIWYLKPLLTFTTAPSTSDNSICVTGRLVNMEMCFFKALYFSSTFSRRPYLIGIDPSNRITTNKKPTCKTNHQTSSPIFVFHHFHWTIWKDLVYFRANNYSYQLSSKNASAKCDKYCSPYLILQRECSCPWEEVTTDT